MSLSDDACPKLGLNQITHCFFWGAHSSLHIPLLQNVPQCTVMIYLYHLHVLNWTITLLCTQIKALVSRKVKEMCDIS